MRWTIKGADLTSFLNEKVGVHRASPIIKTDDISWKLFVYPKGYTKNDPNPYVQIWLTSINCPTHYQFINLSISLVCSISDASWKKTILLDQKNSNCFNYQFDPIIKVSTLQCVGVQSSTKKIRFECTLNIINDNQSSSNSDGPISVPINRNKRSITIISNKNKQKNRNKQISKPIANATAHSQLQTEQKENPIAKNNINNINQDQKQSDNDLNVHKQILTTNIDNYNDNSHSNCIIWKIANQQLKQLLIRKVGKSFSSPIFNISNCKSKFKLILYPYGDNNDNCGCLSLHLQCIETNAILVNLLYDINVIELDIYQSAIRKFSSKVNNNAFYSKTYPILDSNKILFNQLKDLNSITFKIQYLSLFSRYLPINNDGIGFIDKIDDILINKHLNMSWNIPINRIHNIISSRCNIWCFKLMYNNNRLILELMLVITPYNISDIETEIIMKNIKFKIEYKKKFTFRVGKQQSIQWIHAIELNKLNKLKYIEFEIEINVIKVIDRQKREITDKYITNNNYNGNMDDNNIDAKQKEKEIDDNKIIMDKLIQENNDNKNELLKLQKRIQALALDDTKNKVLTLKKQIEDLNNKLKSSNNMKSKPKMKMKIKSKSKMIQAPTYPDEDQDISISDHDASDSVELWLQYKVKLPIYLNKFLSAGWDDMDVIKEIKEKHLLKMHIDKEGHRVKIMMHVNKLRKTNRQFTFAS